MIFIDEAYRYGMAGPGGGIRSFRAGVKGGVPCRALPMASWLLGHASSYSWSIPGASGFSTRAAGRHPRVRVEVLPPNTLAPCEDSPRARARAPSSQKSGGSAKDVRQEKPVSLFLAIWRPPARAAQQLFPSPRPCRISLKHFGARRQTSGGGPHRNGQRGRSLPCHSLPSWERARR